MVLHGVGVRILADSVPVLYDFYTQKLGFRAVWGDRNSSYVAFAEAEIDKPALAVFARSGMGEYTHYVPMHGRGDNAVFCTGAQDVDAMYRHLSSKGVRFLGEPRNIPGWDMRCVYFRDPEGNLFEIAGEMK